jgi:RNA polymerase subunit RPABC4/transcription elongation factor Spt4
MSRFTRELKVIPWGAWVIGALIYLGFATPIFLLELPTDPQFSGWPRWGQALLAYGMLSLIIPFVALIGYVYGDAKRRNMRYVMWTLLAIFVPYLIGVIVYFLLRDPLPRTCPGCGNLVKVGFTFCPLCGTTVQPTCPNCGKAVELGWSNCPHCGQSLPSKSPRAA